MTNYPQAIVPVGHMEPVPRRIRAMLGARTVLDTTRAIYLWERAPYPQYYIPVEDIDPQALSYTGETGRGSRGAYRRIALSAGGQDRPDAGRVYTEDSLPGLAGLARLDWTAPEAWFEEDEEVFVHPRSPYTRVDALRSTRRVRIALAGVPLADSASPVMVFETGLPTRYYLNRTDVDLTRLRPSDTRSACPYKGRTTGYWHVEAGGRTYEDLAWSYDFPTRQLLPIAGLIAFYNEKVDITVG
jgi:uncharacterized protein (DUF427 family)